ncbi:Acetyltransferase (GNAT) domain [Rhizoctonia solani]|uniref:Acetyltransferase (GNAT) domain n=1 Tax=Rhizoctonia solani TaxID=456999 RepID=A0A8H7IB39_9AGAM|nr:Acetyltransferase (GNAT) domain [Rhizoctonia solani]
MLRAYSREIRSYLQHHSPFAIKVRKNERLPVSNARGAAYWSAPQAAPTSQVPRQFWMTQWTSRGASSVPTLDFVLALTEGLLGAYPHNLTPIPRRSKPVVNAFTNVWTQVTGKIPEPEAFYAAKFSYCTRKHLQPTPQLPSGHELRLATLADLDQCAQLCKEFADDSVYFPLSLEGGRQEAKSMIEAKHLWVYATPQGIATIVASTRRTPNAVASINKVYTPPISAAVVLYVSHGNPAARVYNRVGFQGLDDNLPLPPFVENWLETGFQATQRGHW